MTDPDRDIRTLLEDAVSDVEPRRGLDEITARTTSAPRRRPWAWGTAGAVLATAAVVAAVVAVTGLPGSGPSRPGPADGGTADTATSPWVVPVYYVGDTGAGPRLFRERHVGPPSRSDDKDLDAVQQAVDGDAFDPDYRSDWPAGTHADSVRAGGGATTVALSGGSLSARPAGVSAAEARAALQQLVYTVRANLGNDRPVRFEVDGSHAATLLGVPTSGDVAAASRDTTLAPVSIDSPADQRSRDLGGLRSPVTVTGSASAFEATVQWELEQGGTVVKRGFATARECCTLSPYSFRFSAPPGDYTLVVHDEDPSGGEGTGTSSDSKQIRVTGGAEG
jgi:hypothetical protein